MNFFDEYETTVKMNNNDGTKQIVVTNVSGSGMTFILRDLKNDHDQPIRFGPEASEQFYQLIKAANAAVQSNK